MYLSKKLAQLFCMLSTSGVCVCISSVSVAAGWLLFMVFCGAGLVALPMDMIREFLGRPKACITKSEYMTRAKALGNKAKGIMVRDVQEAGS